MVGGVPVPTERGERLLGPLGRSPDGGAPSGVVGFREAWEETGERSLCALADPVRQIVPEDFDSAALEQPGGTKEPGDDAIPSLLGLSQPAPHAVTRLPAGVGVGDAPLVENSLRRERGHDALAEVVGVASGDVDVESRIIRPGCPRLSLELSRRDMPTIAEPDRNGAAVRRRRLARAVQHEGARFPRRSVAQADGGAGDLDRGAEESVALGSHRRLVRSHGGYSPLMVTVPFGALGRLNPVLAADSHQHPLIGERLECLSNFLPERDGLASQVLDEQVGERSGVRSDTGVHGGLPGQFPDQKDQARQISSQPSSGRVVVEPLDAGVDLVQEHPRVHEVRRHFSEQVARRDHRPEIPVGEPPERVVQDRELGPELAPRPLGVHRPQAGFPEPPPGGEQRVVLHAFGAVTGHRADGGLTQMPRHLAVMFVEHRADRRVGGGLLGK